MGIEVAFINTQGYVTIAIHERRKSLCLKRPEKNCKRTALKSKVKSKEFPI